ncbi:FHA domain-containing protein [Novipirellula caenicola]|uniref:FHA domain-containing protein n=1 Tax=Novipirellula caenicola TaxID=1536901 RepID=A0ABP9VMW8_9BACT
MIAQLILATGSHAGITASIQLGYYMIGRHGECQIRPKSRSVSRRHCILHHTETQLLALDLDSSSGTCINGEKIVPNRWIELNDGDQLRCGKVVFDVCIKTRTHANVESVEQDEFVPAIADAADAEPDSSQPWPAESMLQGEAWQECDVADMLYSADDSDREQRYKAIRAISELKSDDSSLNAGNVTELGNLSEGDTLTDEPSTTADTLDHADDESTSEPSSSESTSAAPKLEKTKKVKADSSRSHNRKPKKSRPPLRLPSISLPSDFESLKLVGAILISIAVIGLFSYSVYRFQSGPPVKIVKGIE